MAILYLDTSALVKLYVIEAGTERMLELGHPDSGHRLAILSLARVEFRSAIRRRARSGDIDPTLSDVLIQNFGGHLASLFQVQPVNEVVLQEAAEAVDRHFLRAYDAVQLAGCLALRSTVMNQLDFQFICADQSLLDAAREDGIVAIDPTVD